MGSGPALLSELTHEGALPLSLRFLERQSPPRFAEAPSAAEGEAEGAGIFILNDPALAKLRRLRGVRAAREILSLSNAS